jgi:hypothetical protein
MNKQSNSRTTTTKNGETFEYVRLRIRADIVDALEEIRPKHLNLTEFLNEVLEGWQRCHGAASPHAIRAGYPSQPPTLPPSSG